MRYSCTALVLATAIIGQVAAGPVKHAHAQFHDKKDVEALKVEATAEKRAADLADVDWSKVHYTYSVGQTWGQPTPAAAAAAAPAEAAPAAAATPAPVKPADSEPAKSVTPASETLSSADSSKLISLGFQAVGVNADSSDGGVWVGDDGAYTNEFINSSAEDIIVVIWGPWASWVNAKQPLITHSLPAGTSATVSFVSGSVGAWSAIYPDTEVINGQVANTWGEYTFSVEGVVDVSREVNMAGNPMKIEGPSCVTDMETCVFVCSEGNSCEFGYQLLNCAAGSQAGAQYGVFDGAPSGGCGGLGSSAAIKTTFS